jgi:hypothetical protein
VLAYVQEGLRVMSNPSPATRALAKHLVAAEAENQSVSQAKVHAATRVCAKLQRSLVPFVGLEGYTVLLRRSLTLARADIPSLETIRVAADGRLERTQESPAVRLMENEEAIALIGYLLGLLITFIGEPLTLRLIRKSLPDAAKQIIVKSEEPE